MIDPRLKKHIRDLIESDTEIDSQTRKKLAKEFGCRTVDVANVIYRVKNPFYWRKHRTRQQVVAQNSRARNLGIEGQIELEEWNALREKYNHVCLCCGEAKPLCIDHIMPISKGGTNTIDNIQPLCHECNREKQDKCIDYRDAELSPAPSPASGPAGWRARRMNDDQARSHRIGRGRVTLSSVPLAGSGLHPARLLEAR